MEAVGYEAELQEAMETGDEVALRAVVGKINKAVQEAEAGGACLHLQGDSRGSLSCALQCSSHGVQSVCIQLAAARAGCHAWIAREMGSWDEAARTGRLPCSVSF